MSEIAPKKVRGALVSGYQFCITIGILIANGAVYATKYRNDTSSYRIPIGIQFIWALVLGVGLLFLPESPRFFVKKGKLDEAAKALSSVRGQPVDSELIQAELAEIIANHEYEQSVIPSTSYLGSWANCFRGSLKNGSSNIRRTLLGILMQMMQQLTGINFIFYFGNVFLTSLGTIHNPFLISILSALINTLCTPLAFYAVDRWGRRTLLIWGSVGMIISQYIIGIIGVTAGKLSAHNNSAVSAMIAFIMINVGIFSFTWGPVAWVVIGEIFPLPIRSRGVGLSTSSNWMWNCIIGVITPYLVGTAKGDANLGAKIYFMWGSLCVISLVFSYFLVPETKGLTLEQVDRMLEETTPRTSSKWTPHSTFAGDMGLADKDVIVDSDLRHNDVSDKENHATMTTETV